MQFCDYVYDNNGEAVRNFLQQLGYRFNTVEEGRTTLHHHVRKGGEKAVNQLLPLHPDYEMLNAYPNSFTPVAADSTAPSKPAYPSDRPVPNTPSIWYLPSDPLQDIKRVTLILFCVFLLINIIKS